MKRFLLITITAVAVLTGGMAAMAQTVVYRDGCGTMELTDQVTRQAITNTITERATIAYRKKNAARILAADEKIFHAYDYTDKKINDIVCKSLAEGAGWKLWVAVKDTADVSVTALDSINLMLSVSTPGLSLHPDKPIPTLLNELLGLPPNKDGDNVTDFVIVALRGAGGYFWKFDQTDDALSNKCDVVFIDAPTVKNYLTYALSTLAHEYQHLLHFKSDKNETRFVNEGMSQWAETVCGFAPKAPEPYLNNPATDPDFAGASSFFDWNEDAPVTDYHAYVRSQWFMMFCADQYGVDAMKRIFTDPLTGAASLQHALGVDSIKKVTTGFAIANSILAFHVSADGLPMYRILRPEVRITPFRSYRGSFTDTLGYWRSLMQYGTDYLRFEAMDSLDIQFTAQVSGPEVTAIIQSFDGSIRTESFRMPRIADPVRVFRYTNVLSVTFVIVNNYASSGFRSYKYNAHGVSPKDVASVYIPDTLARAGRPKLAFSGDGKMLAWTELQHGRVLLASVDSIARPRVFDAYGALQGQFHPMFLQSVAVSRTGRYVAALWYEPNRPPLATVFNAATGAVVTTIPAKGLHFESDESTLRVFSSDGWGFMRYDLTHPDVPLDTVWLETNAHELVCFSADGRYAAVTYSGFPQAQIFDTYTGTMLAKFWMVHLIGSGEFSPDNRSLRLTEVGSYGVVWSDWKQYGSTVHKDSLGNFTPDIVPPFNAGFTTDSAEIFSRDDGYNVFLGKLGEGQIYYGYSPMEAGAGSNGDDFMPSTDVSSDLKYVAGVTAMGYVVLWHYRKNLPPVLTADSNMITVKAGQEMKIALHVQDSIYKTISYFIDSAPNGVTVEQTEQYTGVLSWTPSMTQQGKHTLRIGVSDGFLTDTVELTVNVVRQSSSVRSNSTTATSVQAWVFPNPVSEYATFRISSPISTDADIAIVNTAGRTVQRIRHQIIAGENLIRVSCSTLAQGSYRVMVDCHGDVAGTVMVVQR